MDETEFGGRDIDELTTDEVSFASSALSHGIYDYTNGELEVFFVKGGSHTYTVSLRTWEGLKASGSKGQYFNANIRNS